MIVNCIHAMEEIVKQGLVCTGACLLRWILFHEVSVVVIHKVGVSL